MSEFKKTIKTLTPYKAERLTKEGEKSKVIGEKGRGVC
jgi:hypothetical protein